eukprot:gene5256-3756_t
MNRVLTSLDLADTALTLDDLLAMGRIAFQHNTTLRHVNLEDNFLPPSVAKIDSFSGDEDSDVRSFLQSEFPDTCNDLLPLSSAAEVESANASLLWIQDIREKVKASIEVNAIVDVTTGELRRQDEEEPTASDDPEYFDRKMYHPDVVQHSSYYATPEYLRDRIVRDMQELYSTFYAHLAAPMSALMNQAASSSVDTPKYWKSKKNGNGAVSSNKKTLEKRNKGSDYNDRLANRLQSKESKLKLKNKLKGK